MYKGDISNEVAPRWLFVWENQIARLPPNNVRKYKRALVLHRYETACRLWRPDDYAMRWLSDFSWRRGGKCDAVTFMHGQHWAEAIRQWCDIEEVPVANCFYFEDRLTLGRRLSTWPSVQGVVDPVAPGAYGAKGYSGIGMI